MREKFRQFMIGRYGTDGLNQFLSIASIVLLLISLLTRFSLFTWLGLVLLVLCYYRSLSRNISKRTEENYQYYALKDRVDRKFRGLKDQWPTASSTTTTAAPSAARSCVCPVAAAASRSPARAAAPSSSKELSGHVWLCCAQSGCAFGRSTKALPHRLLRAVPPHRRTARPAGPLYAEL